MVDSGNSYGDKVSRLVSWGHWFTFFNIIATMLIGTRYITQSPWPDTLLGQSYLALSWIGHFGFLVFALYLLILFPLTFIVLSRKLYRFIAVIFATIGLTVLLLDTEAYQQIHLHLNPVVWELLLEGEASSSVTIELQQLFVVVPIIFLLQLALSEWVWRKQRKLSHKHVGRPITALFFVCFITSHLVYIWADAYFYGPITSQKANFPLSYPMTAKTFMEKHGLLDREEYLKRMEESEGQVDLVSYPTEPLVFSSRPQKLNVLMVMVNNLRSDTMTPEVMPETYNFANNNQKFNNHYSASNDSYGVFGLFYGIPNSYAGSIKSQGSSPLILEAMQDKGYDFGLFSGSGFEDDLYYEAIFKSREVTAEKEDRLNSSDAKAITDWTNWIEGNPGKPWFSYIELTTVEKYEDYEIEDLAGTPKQRLSRAYQKAATIADEYIGDILFTLMGNDLMEDTIVIITSNHGTEFNETNTNSWGSNTNYSDYQLKVPFVMHWPGKMATMYSHKSSHFDVSTTLLQDLMGVTSKPREFSSGRSLFNNSSRMWILAGDNREIALVTDKSTTVVDQFGNYKVYDKHYKRQREAKPKLSILMQGLSELKRFYTREQN
ncbi:DUF3413 domain-containing protein [Vibrio hannami]|uniref:DUF3413 domain-containing protein n=1 Tax=Vibrio hannami TaxID=2717094 RepID=UPI002410ADE7|nr:DUF3413 domain-containing protein [Vibrio hannami]MDG3088620.1 DUF3413 domain-containing protein [Vibrio hannami]